MSTPQDCHLEPAADLFYAPDLLIHLSHLHDLLDREWHLTAPTTDTLTPLRVPSLGGLGLVHLKRY